MDKIKRTAKGQFAKDAPSPNKYGRGGKPGKEKPRRFYTSDQVAADFLSQCEEPMTVTLKGRKVTMPTIEVANRRLLEKATAGDLRALFKVLDMRERYAAARTDVLGSLLQTANKVRTDHDYKVREVPEGELLLAQEIMRVVAEGQYSGMNPPINPFALKSTEQIEATRAEMRRDREEIAATDAETLPDPLDEVRGDQ